MFSSLDAPHVPSVSVSSLGEVTEGSSVTLTCSSDANPAANYTWFKRNRDPGPQHPSKEQQLGQHNCIAENELGKRTSEHVLLDVKCE